MPCFPPPGSVTLCEINRDLITADGLSNDRAKETYGRILGVVFNPIPFQPELLQIPEPDSEEERHERMPKTGLAAYGAILSNSLKRIFPPKDVNLLKEVALQGVSWHHHKNLLAFICGPHNVSVRDYEDKEEKELCTLTSDSQRDVKVLEWRPNGGRTLSVACKGGVCIWSASYRGNVAIARSGIGSYVGTLSRGSGTRWTLVDFLQSTDGKQITALSWSPDGRYPNCIMHINAFMFDLFILLSFSCIPLTRDFTYLASASAESSSFTVWDLAQGLGTPIRRGLGGISILKWSPSGDYFFTSKEDGSFYLWETNTWTSEPWSSSSGYVTGAAWDPDGHMILLAFSESTLLGSVHFVSRPPSLEAQLLPVELPEIFSLTGSDRIERIAWDGSGERLAVSYRGGNDVYSGLIAVYDVRRTPLVSVSFIGFIRGPGENPKPLAFSFHDRYKQGPLLSVCWSSGWCCTYPLIFHSNLLP